MNKILSSSPVAYSNALCVNENEEKIVTAYRFTNNLSFYNLDGILETSFYTNNTIVTPTRTDKDIDVKASTKCFIWIYGTLKYVYCLYDGSADFSNNSQMYIYTWDGDLKGHLQLDRNIRTFAASEDDSYIIAVSRSEHGGQDILKYKL